jgi:hypothetical protein
MKKIFTLFASFILFAQIPLFAQSKEEESPPIIIFSPKEGEKVGYRPTVEGKFKVEQKFKIYILTRSLDVPHEIWVQPIPSVKSNHADKTYPRKFQSKIYVGRYGQDTGIKFEIVAVATKKKLKEGQRLSDWDESEAEYQSDVIEVVRGD